MENQNLANDLIYSMMRNIMKRFDGPLQFMMGGPLMDFDEQHLQPLISGEYAGSRGDYYNAVQKFMTHMANSLNNIYDDHTDLAGLMDEQGIKHNIEPNGLLAEHTLILLEAYGEE